MLIVLLIAGFSLIGTTVSTYAQQPSPTLIYVSTTGSNTTGNGSPNNPYATISYAVSVAPPYSVINVEPGIYHEMVIITKPLTLEPTQGRPVIDATGQMFGIWVKGMDSNGTVVDGFAVQNADSHGIYVQDTFNVLIQNNNVVHNDVAPFPSAGTTGPFNNSVAATQVGIELDGVSNSTVADNLVTLTANDGGIAVHSESVQFTAGAPGEIVGEYNAPAINNFIIDNTILDNHGGCGVVISSFNPGEPVAYNYVIGNTITSNAAGVIVATNGPFESVNNTLVEDNYILNNEGPNVVLNLGGSLITNTTFRANIISGNAAPSTLPNAQPTGILLQAIPIQHLPPAQTQDSSITDNTIANEYYGVLAVNVNSTAVSGNTMDSSVTIRLAGVTPLKTRLESLDGVVSGLQSTLGTLQSTINQLQSSLSTISSQVNSLQSSSASQTSVNVLSGEIATAMDVAYLAIVIAIVLGVIAIVVAMRKR